MTREQLKLPSKALFCHGTIPEPLSTEERLWLVEQLRSYPRRVNEERTCAIGALTDMATTEFCRLMAERASPPSDTTREQLAEARKMWQLAAATLERDVLLHGLTSDEQDVLIGAVINAVERHLLR